VEQHENVGSLRALNRLLFVAVGLLLENDASLSFGVVLLCACVGLLFIADVLLFETDVKLLFHALLLWLHDVFFEQDDGCSKLHDVLLEQSVVLLR